MTVMPTVCIVIAENTPVIGLAYSGIDVGKTVA